MKKQKLTPEIKKYLKKLGVPENETGIRIVLDAAEILLNEARIEQYEKQEEEIKYVARFLCCDPIHINRDSFRKWRKDNPRDFIAACRHITDPDYVDGDFNTSLWGNKMDFQFFPPWREWST